jgi:hypothetical protein
MSTCRLKESGGIIASYSTKEDIASYVDCRLGALPVATSQPDLEGRLASLESKADVDPLVARLAIAETGLADLRNAVSTKTGRPHLDSVLSLDTRFARKDNACDEQCQRYVARKLAQDNVLKTDVAREVYEKLLVTNAQSAARGGGGSAGPSSASATLINGQLSALASRVGELEANKLDAAVVADVSETKAIAARLDGALGRLETQAEEATASITAVTSRVDALTTTADATATRAGALTTRVDALTTTADALTTTADATALAVQGLETYVGENDVSRNVMRRHVNALQEWTGVAASYRLAIANVGTTTDISYRISAGNIMRTLAERQDAAIELTGYVTKNVSALQEWTGVPASHRLAIADGGAAITYSGGGVKTLATRLDAAMALAKEVQHGATQTDAASRNGYVRRTCHNPYPRHGRRNWHEGREGLTSITIDGSAGQNPIAQCAAHAGREGWEGFNVNGSSCMQQDRDSCVRSQTLYFRDNIPVLTYPSNGKCAKKTGLEGMGSGCSW